MEALVLIVVLSVTVIVGTTIGGRYRVAPPVLLITMGALLALLPPLSHVMLDPEVVLLLFLPPILYRESLTTSLREIRANVLVIALLAVGLVGATMVVVALVGMRLGVDPAVAWVLGAVLAPTDAAAVAGLAKRMPRRILTTLRGESLINDGTALVLFAVAVDLIVTGTEPTPVALAERLVGASVEGVAAGLLVGWLVIQVRRRLDDPMREGALSVLTPFAAFLLAEVVHASGVLAVVVAGLVLAYAGPRVVRARSRVVAYAFWDLSTFLLNGSLFVLLGMQVPRALRGVSSVTTARAVMIAVVIAVVVVAVRLVWIHASTFVARAVRPSARHDPEFRPRVATAAGWAGFRGAVSLAAALAVPRVTSGGEPVFEHDLIVFVTALVIVLVMLVQGTTLPLVVRWAGLVGDQRRGDEVRLARRRAGEAGLAALPGIAERLGVERDAADRLRADYEDHLDRTLSEEVDETAEEAAELERQLRLTVLDHKRRELTRLRDANEIDDIVLREVQAALDIEEIRLLGPQTGD